MKEQEKIATKLQKLEIWRESKESLATDWFREERQQKKRHIKRGEIYLCEIGENIGHEQCEVRPVIVLSDTRYNKNGMVTVAPLTKKIIINSGITSKKAPRILTHYILRMDNYDFLTYDSTVLVEQIKSISPIRLTKFIGCVSENDMGALKNRLKSLFGI